MIFNSQCTLLSYSLWKTVCILILSEISLRLRLERLGLLGKVRIFTTVFFKIQVIFKAMLISSLSKQLLLYCFRNHFMISFWQIVRIMIRMTSISSIRRGFSLLINFMRREYIHIWEVRVIQTISGCRSQVRFPL